MPSFADDGAAGATNFGAAPTAATSGFGAASPSASSTTGFNAPSPYGAKNIDRSKEDPLGMGNDANGAMLQQVNADHRGTNSSGTYGGGADVLGMLPINSSGAYFADGGAVEGVDDSDPTARSAMANPMMDKINAALGVVDNVLSYGRKLHGLGDGGDEPGAIQTASARMPSVPGNPSESGVRRPQPMPGPLPPTSNPFGKRNTMASADTDNDAGSEPDNDADDQSGAINTEETA